MSIMVFRDNTVFINEVFPIGRALFSIFSRLATSRLRESERKRGTKSRDASESRQKSRLVPPAEY